MILEICALIPVAWHAPFALQVFPSAAVYDITASIRKEPMQRRRQPQISFGWAIALAFAVLPIECKAYSYMDFNLPGVPGYAGSEGLGISGGQQAGAAEGPAASNNYHAVIWTGTGNSIVDLNPAGFTTTYATATSGSQQVGYGDGTMTGGTNDHALLWSGNASSVVDLNGSLGYSVANGMSGNNQVGYGATVGGNQHALVWSGTASSVRDFNGAFLASWAFGISGAQVVGGAVGFHPTHAIIWDLVLPTSVDDINPSFFTSSIAVATSGGQQVGYGYNAAGPDHAVLWNGTAASAVDLNPAGFTSSDAYAVSRGLQVGAGSGPATGNNKHALLWAGSASSFVDLQSVLSTNYLWSEATGIDTNGNIIGEAYYIPDSTLHTILWAVPEPNSIGLLAGAVLTFIAVRFKSFCIRPPTPLQRADEICGESGL
jgi:hypothetical protein